MSIHVAAESDVEEGWFSFNLFIPHIDMPLSLLRLSSRTFLLPNSFSSYSSILLQNFSSTSSANRHLSNDITIVGGGLVGAALACSLRSHPLTSHLKLALIDSTDPLANQSIEKDELGGKNQKGGDVRGCGLRQSTFTKSSKKLLEDVGVWKELIDYRQKGLSDNEKAGERNGESESLIGKVREMIVWDGESCIKFDGESMGEYNDDRIMAWVCDNDAVRSALWKRLRELNASGTRDRGIDIVIGKVVQVGNENREGDGGLNDGEQWQRVVVKEDKASGGEETFVKSRIVVAADGARSVVRNHLGMEWVTKRLGRAVVANIKAINSDGIAWQRFLEDDDGNNAGVLAVLPMGRKSWANVIWSTNETDANILNQLDDTMFVNELNLAIQGKNGKTDAFSRVDIPFAPSESERQEKEPFPVAQEVFGKRASFPLTVGHAPQYVDTTKRTVLVGDAAHSVHPLAGQGVNMGFADVAKLTECIAKSAATGQDIGIDRLSLQRYQTERIAGNIGMIGLLHGLKYAFGLQWGPFRLTRRIGVGALNQMEPLKAAMMKIMS